MVLFYDISYISSVPSIILVYTSMASISKQYIFSGVLNHSIAFKTMSVFVCCAVFIFISLLFICFLNYMRSVFCNYKGNFGNNTISYNEIFCVFFVLSGRSMLLFMIIQLLHLKLPKGESATLRLSEILSSNLV